MVVVRGDWGLALMSGAGPLGRSVLVLVGAVVALVGLLSHMTPADVIIDPLLMLAVTGGIVGGRSTGASFGAGCGLASDLIVHMPFGVSLLVLTLLGYLSGLVAEQVPTAGRYARSAMAAPLAAAGIGLYGSAGWLMDLDYVTEAPLVRIAIVSAIAAAVANPLLERVARWALTIRPQVSAVRATR